MVIDGGPLVMTDATTTRGPIVLLQTRRKADFQWRGSAAKSRVADGLTYTAQFSGDLTTGGQRRHSGTVRPTMAKSKR